MSITAGGGDRIGRHPGDKGVCFDLFFFFHGLADQCGVSGF